MSQPDLAAALRAARPVASPELRERVHLLAASAAPPRRRQLLTWRNALVVAVPVALAVAAGVLATRSANHRAASVDLPYKKSISAGARAAIQAGTATKALAPLAPSTSRIQRYSTSLELRVRDAASLSDASKRAVAVVRSLGGYEQRVHVDAARTSGYADLVLRVPKNHVQEAVRRLTTLGTIVGENVQVQDLQGQVDATDRRIGRLQQRIALLRNQSQDTETQQRIAALTAQAERLQRGRASTLRSARYSTVELRLSTVTPAAPLRQGRGPFHRLGVAFRWIGIGAVYALAIGTPLAVLAFLAWLGGRSMRRRREDALLSRP